MKHATLKLISLGFIALMLVSLMPAMLNEQGLALESPNHSDGLVDSITNQMNTDFNLTNEYQKIWEPNNVRGSTHAIAVTEDQEWMASAGGYLNDREVHIFRWYDEMRQYYPVWDAGDGVIQGDVMDVDFMDANNNGKLEVVAGSADGRIYVFEQIGNADDPFTPSSTPSPWELVWDSGMYIDRQVWSVLAYDIDHDSHDEIIAGAWDGKIYVFDYIDSSAYPYCLDEHWLEFEPVWDSGDTITDRVSSIAIVDSDNDSLVEIVAGSYDSKVYLFEECPCRKNFYVPRWNSGDTIWAPVTSVTASQNLDEDGYGEIVASAYGQGVFVFDYNSETEDFDVRKLNQGIKSWERGLSETTGVYTGYEADEWIDKKVFGWEAQGIYENDPIPAPWDTEYLGGASALGGPWDDQETTFDSTEQFQFMREWEFTTGTGLDQAKMLYDIAMGLDGSIYMTDILNNRVVRYDDDFEPIQSWGMTGNETGNFSMPTGIAIDTDGFVYVTDYENDRVQKFTAEGIFVASFGTSGTGDGEFYHPFGVAVSPDGLLFVSDYFNNRIQVLNKSTGAFINKWGASGSASGEFNLPAGLAVDAYGNLLVADYTNDRVQQFYPNGTFIRTWGTTGSAPGDMNGPVDIAVDGDGRIYVTDIYNHRVQKFSPSGNFESEWGSSGSGPGQFVDPIGICVTNDGILVTDSSTNRVQKFAIQEYELVDTHAIDTNVLSTPLDIAFDSEGNYYVTGVSAYVLKYSPDGTLLLNWSVPSSWLFGIAVDDDIVYVTDATNDKLYLFDVAGNLQATLGGTGTGNGELNGPIDVVVQGDLYFVSEFYNHRISVFNKSAGFVRHIGSAGSSLGQFNTPYGLEIGPDGLLYVSDRYNFRIQRFYQNGTVIDAWSVPDDTPFIAFDAQGYLYGTGGPAHTIKKISPEGILVDTFDDEVANYFERVGVASSWGIEYLAANDSFVIADQTSKKLLMLHPYTTLNNVSTAVVDFGQWEELGGDATDKTDLLIIIEDDISIENMELAISRDMKTWEPLQLTEQYTNYIYINFFLGWTGFLSVDVDHALRAARWDEFRYLRIGVKGGAIYNIDAAYGTVARPIDTALTVSTGYVRTSSTQDGILKIIIGTVDGEIMAYGANGVRYWESQSDQPRFSLGASIWDIVQVWGKGMIPTWVESGSLLTNTDVQTEFPSFSSFLSYALVDIDGTSAYDLVAIILDGAQAKLLYYRNTGTDENPVFSYVANYFVTHSDLANGTLYNYATVTFGDMDGDADDDMIITTAGIDVDTGYIYTVRYFEQTSVDYWTEQVGYLTDLSTVVTTGNFVPRVTMVDYDNDGDTDLVVATDQLYYFERTGYSYGIQFHYTLDASFFETINADKKNETVFGKVTFWDFDLDNDLDIVVPNASENYTARGYKCSTGRFTYWKNTGSRQAPEWTKTRAMFEPDFTGTLTDPDHGYDYPQFIDLTGDGVVDLVALKEDSIDMFNGTIQHDTFLVATYPYIHMVEVDKRSQTYGYWGYEAFDSWTNWRSFERWSQSIEYGDVDQDGKPEVFVGSFDNNIIAFEQVANDTYRRSWRSPDFLLYNYFSSGVYPFRLDVKDMVIGDQDQDGKQEIIVCAGYNIYVFEMVGNDQYEPVWSTEFKYWKFDITHLGGGYWVYMEPSIVTVDKDLDRDGFSEIVVGVNEYLYIFENTGDDSYELVTTIKYTTLEDGYPRIHDIKTGDVDNDGFQDIVIVGTEDIYDGGFLTQQTGWVRLVTVEVFSNGTVHDNTYITFDTVKPQFAAYRVALADNDGNQYPEIFVGTGGGVVIYEMDASSTLNEMNFLTTAEKVNAIQVENTDGDSWFDIIVGTGKNLMVFEQNQTKDRAYHIYDVVWTSGEMHENITDIRIGDSNLNDRKEILATALKGYLYAFEWIVNSSAIATSPAFSMASGTGAIVNPEHPDILCPVMAQFSMKENELRTLRRVSIF